MGSKRYKVVIVCQEEAEYRQMESLLANARQAQFDVEWLGMSRYQTGSLSPESRGSKGGASIHSDDSTTAILLVGENTAATLAMLTRLISGGCRVPVLYLAPPNQPEVEEAAQQAGAADVLDMQDLSPALLERAIRYAVNLRKMKETLNYAQETVRRNKPPLPASENQHLRDALSTAQQATEQAITDARKAAREARMAAIRLEAIINSLSGAVLVFDRDGTVQLANSFAIALLGFDPIHMPRETMLRRIKIFNRNGSPLFEHDLHFNRAEQGEMVFHEPVSLTNRRGRTYDLLASALPYYIGREFNGVVVVWTDVTRLEQLQEEILTKSLEIQAEQIAHQTHTEVQRQLIQHREMERVQIARHLHDTVLQDLIAFNFGLVEAMDMRLREERTAKLRWLQEGLTKEIRDLRAYCNDLRPPVLAPFGLEKTLRSYLDALKERHPQLMIHTNLMNDGKRLSEGARMALFRTFQELIANVIDHSQASTLAVELKLDDELLYLSIADNGVGFDIPEDWVEKARQGRLGIISARERVESIGGELIIDSQPGAGARFEVRLPLRDGLQTATSGQSI